MIDHAVFVSQAGELERKSLILAASLRRHFPLTVKLTAAHPAREGALQAATLRAFKCMGVEVVPITNPLDATYLVGQKLAALALIDKRAKIGLFLDSDILAMRPPAPLCAVLSAVPACRDHLHSRGGWDHTYGAFRLPFPSNAPGTLVSHETAAPYFNSGMIAVPGALAELLSDTWVDCAQRIDADHAVPLSAKRPFLDQVALPIAAAMIGQSIAALDPKWNYPGWDWMIGENEAPIFFHYQNFERLKREQVTTDHFAYALGHVAAIS